MSSATTSVGACATDCAPSTAINAPWPWAIAARSRIGLIVPKTLDMPVIESSFTPVINSSMRERSSR